MIQTIEQVAADSEVKAGIARLLRENPPLTKEQTEATVRLALHLKRARSRRGRPLRRALVAAALDDIMRSTTVFESVRLRDVLGRSRVPEVVRVRFAFCLAAREAGFRFQEIGRYLHREHGAIIHAVRTAKKARQACP